MLKTQHEEKGENKNVSFKADVLQAGHGSWCFSRGVANRSRGLECIDHGVSEEGVRASASNSSTDCYEGPCVSIHPTTL